MSGHKRGHNADTDARTVAAPIVLGDMPDGRWLTVAEVCGYLQVTADEWRAWQAQGDTPMHATGADGELRVRAADFERWLDARTVDASDGAFESVRTGQPVRDPYAYGSVIPFDRPRGKPSHLARADASPNGRCGTCGGGGMVPAAACHCPLPWHRCAPRTCPDCEGSGLPALLTATAEREGRL